MKAPDGRRIMIAWMQAWSNSKFVPDGSKVFWTDDSSRELTLKDNRLIQKPVRELEAYRSGRICHEKVKITEETYYLKEFPDV